jgi:branched-chain amino acid transport system permease protein
MPHSVTTAQSAPAVGAPGAEVGRPPGGRRRDGADIARRTSAYRARARVLQGVLRAVLAIVVLLAVYQVLRFGLFKDASQFVTVTLNGLTLAGLYFLVASGFTLIFGLMRIVNMAHGSLYLLAGYVALRVQGASTGFGSGDQRHSWIFSAIVAALVAMVAGVAVYALLLRWNRDQELRQALITIAVSVIAADQMLAHFGGLPETITAPSFLTASVGLPGGIEYPNRFRIFMLVAALVVGLALWLWMRRTRMGMVIRAGVDDKEMVAALGINVELAFVVTFAVGALLAGFGGVIGGTQVGLQPGEDSQFLLWSLVVVIVGGMGSLGGAAIGALLLGLISSYAGVYFSVAGHDLTNYAILLVFALLVIVLAVRPNGLFGKAI